MAMSWIHAHHKLYDVSSYAPTFNDVSSYTPTFNNPDTVYDSITIGAGLLDY